MKFHPIPIFISFLLSSCHSNGIEKGGNAYETLIVKLNIEDTIEPIKVTLTTSQGIDQINIEPGKTPPEIELKTPQKGEGTCTICVYTTTDTICSPEYYIEGGYRPEIMFKNKQFIVRKGA